MSISASIKDLLRSTLGDSLTARIHGIRFAGMAERTVRNKAELRFASKLLAPGQMAVDIGANGADWTLMMSQAVGPDGEVVAFEAHPYYAMATEYAIRRLRLTNVVLEKFAIGEEAGTVKLATKPTLGASYSGRARIVTVESADCGTVEIPIVSLDAYLKRIGKTSKVDFMKIDTEGYELGVFRGAKKSLAASRPVIILEVGHGWKHGFSDDELQSRIDSLDYNCYAIDEESLTIRRIPSIHTGSQDEIRNRLVVPRDKLIKIESLLS